MGCSGCCPNGSPHSSGCTTAASPPRCVSQWLQSPCIGAVSAGSAPEGPFLLSLIYFLLVPCPNLYMQLNGLMLTLDTPSVLWINLFCLDLCRSLEQFKAIYKLEDSGKRDEHVDVRLDGFRLKVPFFPSFPSLQCSLCERNVRPGYNWSP